MVWFSGMGSRVWVWVLLGDTNTAHQRAIAFGGYGRKPRKVWSCEEN